MNELIANISRRNFLVGLGSTGLVAGLDRHAGDLLRDNRKLGVALLGLGRYSSGQLGPALRETKLCYLAGVVTGHPEKGEKWANDFGLNHKNIYSYETFDRIADNKDIDIVYVVTPPALHPEFVIRAAKAGKHVISEKPMATSIADCDRMIAAAKAAKVKLGVGYRVHYDHYHREMVRLASAKELGPFTEINGDFSFVMGQREFR